MILSAKDRKLLDEMLSDATAWNMPEAPRAGWEEPPATPPKVQERIDDYCDLVERLSAGPW